MPSSSLSPVWFQVLLSLASEPMHGLAITKDVFARTDGQMHLWPGVLYPALKRLIAEKFVDEVDAPASFVSGGGRPRFYRITTSGKRACADEAERLARFVDVARAKKLIRRKA